MRYDKDSLYSYLMYSQPIPYNDVLTFYPVLMKDYLSFQIYAQALQVRKNSWFGSKEIIKMGYGEFLFYASTHPELGNQVEKTWLSNAYTYFLLVLILCSHISTEVLKYSPDTGQIQVKDYILTETDIDNIRRIIILQNGIDFDVDEFLNYDTEKALEKAQKSSKHSEDKATLEDYVDSMMIALHFDEVQISEMPVRKFWRLIQRFNLHEDYLIKRQGECSGMVTFKEPIKHWMIELNHGDKYKSLKTNEDSIRQKINGAND